MDVAIVGATGNAGTALLRRLVDDRRVASVLGIARRPPSWTAPKLTWTSLDVTSDPLLPAFRGRDAVVHLAWQIQPGRDQRRLWHVNVVGSQRVFAAAAEAGVGAVVYASSVGAYSPAPAPDRRVTEEHPTHGIASSTYSRQKAYVERLLDAFEMRHPDIRVVRLRPALIFQSAAASEVRRFFLGTLFPNRLAVRAPVLPEVEGLSFQAVHAEDAADAYQRALHRQVHGAFNVAAEPVLTMQTVADLIDARNLPLPRRALRSLTAASWKLRLHPVEPGWVDLAFDAPLLDTTRARDELGWSPQRTSTEATSELLASVARGVGGPTPTLAPDRSRDRSGELRTGQGARYSTEDPAEHRDTRIPHGIRR